MRGGGGGEEGRREWKGMEVEGREVEGMEGRGEKRLVILGCSASSQDSLH